LGTAYTGYFNFPILENFLNEGNLVNVRNTKIKTALQSFSIQRQKLLYIDNYTDNQYTTSIEPYFYKHINYANVAYGSDNEFLVSGGPTTEYQQFYNNLELWNIITFKLETLNAHQNLLEQFIRMIEYLCKLFDDELGPKK
jgi:hypothetical protein